MKTQQPDAPKWMRITLWLAAVYNVAWGTWVIARPEDLFRLAEIEPPRYPGIWQCVGMIVGVYGVGYAVAATNPLRHWPITLVGFLGKIFGPVGFFAPILLARLGIFGDVNDPSRLPLSWGWTIITNDLIWWVPFAAILYQVFRRSNDPGESDVMSIATANETFQTQFGSTVAELSKNGKVMLMFLRHSGCTFCREALADLADQLDELSQAGIQPVLVHMGDNIKDQAFFAAYGLQDVPRISDASCQLYRAYQLPRGRLGQLFGWQVWKRGFRAAVVDRHWLGKLGGDGFQLGGVFLVDNNQVVKSRVFQTAADRPDYCSFSTAN